MSNLGKSLTFTNINWFPFADDVRHVPENEPLSSRRSASWACSVFIKKRSHSIVNILQCMKMITAVYNDYLISTFIQSPVTPYILVQNNLIITLFSKTLKFSSFLGVTGQI
jgi:hypothetical protein